MANGAIYIILRKGIYMIQSGTTIKEVVDTIQLNFDEIEAVNFYNALININNRELLKLLPEKEEESVVKTIEVLAAALSQAGAEDE